MLKYAYIYVAVGFNVLWIGTRFVLSPFLISIHVFQNGYVPVWSTARRSAAEMNEIRGFGTVP